MATSFGDVTINAVDIFSRTAPTSVPCNIQICTDYLIDNHPMSAPDNQSRSFDRDNPAIHNPDHECDLIDTGTMVSCTNNLNLL